MNTDPHIQQIFDVIEELRKARDDGPRTRKLLDALFRNVHNLKANASANGLSSLVEAAQQFENVLHSLRTGERAADPLVSNAIPFDVWSSLKREQKYALQQSIAEGARLFLVQTDFDLADFERQFQSLKETLTKNGEVISTSPTTDGERPGKINFRILYARRADADSTLSNIPAVRVEEISIPGSARPQKDTNEFENRISILDRSFEKLSAELVNLPAASIDDVLQQALRAGRSAALATGKAVEFEVRGQDFLTDKSLCNTVAYPLLHLVRNAVDHGIETSDERVRLGKQPRGKIVIEAAVIDDQIRITVTDDGRGIDPAQIALIFRPGFSTASEVSAISGRGVGLDAVKTIIENAGGAVSVTSRPGHGSAFKMTFPSTSYPRHPR
jgi:two-component system, chemotaxis family, sensor kinase CheA